MIGGVIPLMQEMWLIHRTMNTLVVDWESLVRLTYNIVWHVLPWDKTHRKWGELNHTFATWYLPFLFKYSLCHLRVRELMNHVLWPSMSFFYDSWAWPKIFQSRVLKHKACRAKWLSEDISVYSPPCIKPIKAKWLRKMCSSILGEWASIDKWLRLR